MRSILAKAAVTILFLLFSGMEKSSHVAILKTKDQFRAYGLKVLNLGDRAIVEYPGCSTEEYFHKVGTAKPIAVFPGVDLKLTCLKGGSFHVEASFRSLQIIWAKIILAQKENKKTD